MPSMAPSVLVICHVSAAELAAKAVRGGALGSDVRNADIDMLCYGRASEDRPAPPGARFVGPPVRESVSAASVVGMLASLRRRGYARVALSQPNLGLSRMRGPLIACAWLLAGRRAVIVDPGAGRHLRVISAGLVAVELARWSAFNLVSRLLAAGTAWLMPRLPERAGAPARPPQSGSVVYLRTDIELRLATLSTGGSVAHTEGILQALLDRGYDVSYWGTGEVAGIPTAIRTRRLPVLLRGNVPIEVAELLSGLLQGLRLRRRSDAAASAFVYQRYSLNNLAGVILARWWRAPLVLEANSSEAKWRQDFGSLSYPRLAYACERFILRRADVVSTVSQNAAKDLLAAGAPAERLHVVPNGVNVPRFAAATPMPLPASLSGAFVICFVGLFYPWHGVRFLAEAFALLYARDPTARLLLVGDGEEAPLVRAVLERSGALEATHFTGMVAREEAPGYMAAADVLVSPHADVHRFIGSPIKLFEYMAAGKPIVATRVAQLEEVLRDGVTGLLVPAQDPAAMAEAIERLHADRGLALRLGRQAQEEAIARHSWNARLSAILSDARGLEPRSDTLAGQPPPPLRPAGQRVDS